MTKPRLQVFQLKQPDESDFQKYPDAERFRRMSRQLSWSIDELIVGRMQWQQVIAISAAAKQSIVTYVQGERVADAEKITIESGDGNKLASSDSTDAK